MKKIIVLFVSLVLSGCSMVIDMKYESLMSDKELYYSSDFDRLGNIENVSRYVRINIKYSVGRGYQNPRETFDIGLGNCTSYTLAYMNTLYFATGVKANAIAVKKNISRDVVNGGDANHVIVELPDGTQIEPQSGEIKHYEVLYRYTFNEVFY